MLVLCGDLPGFSFIPFLSLSFIELKGATLRQTKTSVTRKVANLLLSGFFGIFEGVVSAWTDVCGCWDSEVFRFPIRPL